MKTLLLTLLLLLPGALHAQDGFSVSFWSGRSCHSRAGNWDRGWSYGRYGWGNGYDSCRRSYRGGPWINTYYVSSNPVIVEPVYVERTIIQTVQSVPSVPEQQAAAHKASVQAVWPVEEPESAPPPPPAPPPAAPVPYGSVSAPGQVKSPWSEFTMSTDGKTRGQTVYDANTGNAFLIP
ncbi:MAG: hypothetical protein SFY92_09755 [Verrucomicrobiae bacterium]|nr:hypothetical protein [Verrucomicrobiae bacterium]